MEASADSDGIAPSSQVERGAARSAVWLWSGLALAVGLMLTWWLAHMQQQRADERRHAGLAIVANDVRTSLVDRLEQAALLVRTLQMVFATSREVEPDEFATIYDTLRPRERFPSLQALAYSRRVDVGSRMTFPVEYVAPVAGNERLRGFDVATQPANLRSLIASAETDEPALSAPFALAQGGNGTAPIVGVTMRLPVYSTRRPPASDAARRAALDGSVVASFRLDALIANALPATARDVFRVQVIDVTEGAAQVLYRSHDVAVAIADAPLHVHTIEFGGRRWRIELQPLNAAAPPLGWSRSLLLPGLVASVLFALLVGSLLGTRQRALALGARMSARYRESEARFRALNDLLPALVLLADSQAGRIRYANHAAQLRLGAQVARLALADLFDESELRDRLLRGRPGCDGASLLNAEALMHTANRDRFWASVSVAPIELDGERQLLIVASDISEQRQLTELLGYQASHDALTDLLNRREFERRVEHALAGLAGGAPPFALLFVDLDQFKLINDTSGHAAGDQLLVQLAAVMRDQLRGGDLLARLGGDEFGVLATSVDDLDGALYVAERLRIAIDAHVFLWEQRSYAISASIGGVFVEQADIEPKALFAQADTACYLAKEGGRNRVHFYRERDDQAVRRRTEMDWAHRLRWAAEENRLILQYQEVWPLGVRRDAGGVHVELLLRFREPDGQLVSPGAFMPAAERYGLMPMIDRWVIETALANFDRLHPCGEALQLATINLSGASIEDMSLSALILERIEHHRIDPRRVCFEITETVAVRSFVQVTRFIEPLRAIGCRIALDDFGAGMSSFGYLKSLPLDMIKIDGSFIHDFNEDSMSRAIVRAVTDIGHGRGFEVVAEWVSGHAVADALAEVGVDYAQGFGLHRPQTVVFQRGTERRQS